MLSTWLKALGMGSGPKIGLDSLLSDINLTELNDNGYINLPDSDFPIPIDFTSKAKEHGTGAHIRKERGLRPQIYPVHPLFGYPMWVHLTRQDYRLLLPTLQLASRLLDEPAILPYIKGFLRKPLTPINDPSTEKSAGQPLFSFQSEALLDDWNLEEIWTVLFNLRNCIMFRFLELPDELLGLTDSVNAEPSSFVKGYVCSLVSAKTHTNSDTRQRSWSSHNIGQKSPQSVPRRNLSGQTFHPVGTRMSREFCAFTHPISMCRRPCPRNHACSLDDNQPSLFSLQVWVATRALLARPQTQRVGL